MAKKPRQEKADADARTSIIKLRLSPAEARRVRVAAALADKRPGVFAKEAVLEIADKLIARGIE